jgi:DNA polymerase IV
MDRSIIHLDLDAFFLGVERVVQPSLRGRPAVVGGGGSGNRGVVLSASYEARVSGVRSGMPLAQARRLCPELISVKAHHDLYRRASKAVFRLVGERAPVVQQVSVDEAYLDLTGADRAVGSPLEVADGLQREIRERFRLDVTVAVASNRLVSKIAAGVAKPRGLLAVDTGREARFLAPLAVGCMPGVGKVSRRRLEEIGLLTLGDVQQRSEEDLRAALGRFGPALRRRALGEDRSPVARGRGRRSIGHQRTLSNNVNDLAELEDRLRALLEEAMWRMRGEGLVCRTVEVEIRYPDLSVRSLHRTLERCTDIDTEVWAVARPLLRRLHDRRVGVRRLGVRLSNLTTAFHQLNLVEPERTRDRRHELMRAVDRIREQHGTACIGYARDGRSGRRVGGPT